MSVRQRHTSIVVLFAAALGFVVSMAAQGDEPGEAAKAVQGKWVRHQTTANGRVKIVKEHKGQRTIVTAYDDKENVLYSHESEFKVELSGRVRIFTFFNRSITAGPNAGQKFKEPASFVYRIAENRFIEVHGILEGDANPPNMIIWDRVEEAKGVEAA